jgi:tRNA threonylcarbamoyladenosine biosynthesis protein TsaB
MINKPLLILAIDTSGRSGSVAIAAGAEMLGQREFSAPMRHSAEIFPAICDLLERFDRKPSQIEHVYISVGPGSFTGLRIAVTMAKTMQLANKDVKIVAVDTLDAIAANATDYINKENKTIEKIAAVLDAKRSQFFIAVYQKQKEQPVKVVEDCLMTAEEFIEQFANANSPIWLLGEGLVYYKKAFTAKGIEFFEEKYWTPKASMIHKLGWQKALAGDFTGAAVLQPKYLQHPDIIVKK